MGSVSLILLPKIPSKAPKSQSHSHRHDAKITCSSVTARSQSAKQNLLSLIADQERGLKTQRDPTRRASIVAAIEDLAELGRDTVTTAGDSLSATWRLLWTTEKEQLFIIEKAYLFGTRTGDVLQVIDVDNRTLNNVITFPPDGVFFVRSAIDIASEQRVNFRYFFRYRSLILYNCVLALYDTYVDTIVQRVNFGLCVLLVSFLQIRVIVVISFTSAVLRGKDWEIPLPPFGQGWWA